jgi:hypothetical protein
MFEQAAELFCGALKIMLESGTVNKTFMNIITTSVTECYIKLADWPAMDRWFQLIYTINNNSYPLHSETATDAATPPAAVHIRLVPDPFAKEDPDQQRQYLDYIKALASFDQGHTGPVQSWLQQQQQQHPLPSSVSDLLLCLLSW